MSKILETRSYTDQSINASAFDDLSHLEGTKAEWGDVTVGDTMTQPILVGASDKPYGPLNSPPLNSPEHATLIGTSRERSQAFGLREVDDLGLQGPATH